MIFFKKICGKYSNVEFLFFVFREPPTTTTTTTTEAPAHFMVSDGGGGGGAHGTSGGGATGGRPFPTLFLSVLICSSHLFPQLRR